MSVALQRVSNLISLSISHLALNPAVAASLLYILTTGPASLRARLTTRFAALRDPARHAAIVKALKWALALGVLKTANKTLNHLALNSYRLRAETRRWTWAREVAVVTGGCSGIGLLVVQRLATKGVTVAILDVQALPAALQGGTVASWSPRDGSQLTISPTEARIKLYACDITDPEAVFGAAKAIKKELGSPSILVNNAGVLRAHTVLATGYEELKSMFEVNVLSNWTTVQAFLPDMVAQNKGHVVTVASAASYVGVAGMADYTATKAAVLSFHEALNQELRLSHKAPAILTTSIHPNWVRTPLLAPLEAELKKRGAVIMEPSDVADAVVKQVFSCRGAQVFVPANAGQSSLIRALPNWLQESIRKGVSKTITESVRVGGL